MIERALEGRSLRVVASIATAFACTLALWWAFIRAERVPLLSGVDLGFHEFGHLAFAWAPGLITPLAGSVVQVAVPLGLAAYFWFRRREVLAAALMLAWAGTSAQNVSVYIADAPTEYLPLLGGGRHDWAWILSQIGHIEWAAPLARTVWFVGLVLALAGLALAVSPLLAPRVLAWREGRLRARLALLPRREPRNRVALPGLGAEEVEPDDHL